jgi:diaminohydroxyphosphoribosylaminopyrimidine deaminase / 5-amino-6-(5-phosphoribosylamino)uracil reductase
MSHQWSEIDNLCMDRALECAQRGELHVAPNPLVGCVIVDEDDVVIGSGWHRAFGESHAEVQAYESLDAKDLPRLDKSTWYVTLEPCNHTGKTPPCSDLIVRCNPKRIVVATVDPNPLVSGTGIDRLRSMGLQVDVGCKEAEALWQNRRFIYAMKHRKPWVVLKWARTADGFLDPRLSEERIPKSGGVSITGDLAQTLTHQWRAEEMGILIGSQTALIDEPLLTARKSAGRDPVRFVIDPQRVIPEDHPLFESGASDSRTIRIGSNDVVESVGSNDCVWDPAEGLSALLHQLHATYGIHSLLVEGGAHTLNAFIAEGQWNEMKRWTNPQVAGQGLFAPTVPENAEPIPFGSNQGIEGDDQWERWMHARSMIALSETTSA